MNDERVKYLHGLIARHRQAYEAAVAPLFTELARYESMRPMPAFLLASGSIDAVHFSAEDRRIGIVPRADNCTMLDWADALGLKEKRP